MDEFPAWPLTARSRCSNRSVAGDAMADPAEFAELFDVDVDEFAGMLALIAANRFGRLQRSEPVQTEPLQDAADGSGRDPGFDRDLLARVALPTVAASRRASSAIAINRGVCSGSRRCWKSSVCRSPPTA